MLVKPTDGELVQQALEGSQEASHALVSRYATPAVNLATRMVQDRALGEDLAQEAFVRAFERLSAYDQQRRFVSWFFQILHNVAIDYLRHKRLTTAPLDGLEEASYSAINAGVKHSQPDAQAERSALVHSVDKALALLRAEYREAVILRYREDLSVQEIANVMSVPSGTVKTYLHRGRQQLATILAAQGWGTSPMVKAESSGEKIP